VSVSKIGRNDPCPCGSGRKYKKCCLEKDEAAAREAARPEPTRSETRTQRDEPGTRHFHCATCNATFRMEDAADDCAKCGARFELDGVSYDDDEEEGPHVHCGRCNELVPLPPRCACCGAHGGDLPVSCPECGASLDDAMPCPPSAIKTEYAHDDQDDWVDETDEDDEDDESGDWEVDSWQCGACFFEIMDVTSTNCPNCGISFDEVPMFDALTDFPEPLDPGPEDWLWCSRCFRLFQGRDVLPGLPPASESCPFDDCDGEDYGLDLFGYYPPEGAPVPVKGMPHSNPPPVRTEPMRDDEENAGLPG
jgi:hypothetical protein